MCIFLQQQCLGDSCPEYSYTRLQWLLYASSASTNRLSWTGGVWKCPYRTLWNTDCPPRVSHKSAAGGATHPLPVCDHGCCVCLNILRVYIILLWTSVCDEHDKKRSSAVVHTAAYTSITPSSSPNTTHTCVRACQRIWKSVKISIKKKKKKN